MRTSSALAVARNELWILVARNQLGIPRQIGKKALKQFELKMQLMLNGKYVSYRVAKTSWSLTWNAGKSSTQPQAYKVMQCNQGGSILR